MASSQNIKGLGNSKRTFRLREAVESIAANPLRISGFRARQARGAQATLFDRDDDEP